LASGVVCSLETRGEESENSARHPTADTQGWIKKRKKERTSAGMNSLTHLLYIGLVTTCVGNMLDLQFSLNWHPVCCGLSIVLACLAYLDHLCLEHKFVVSTPSEEDKRHHRVSTAVMELVCRYDPVQGNGALQRFRTVQRNSRCLFAKAATIWGCDEWDRNLSLEQNVARSIPTLQQFLHRGEHEGLDGFLFEIRGKEYFHDIEAFGQTVRRVLTAIADNDRKQYNCMRNPALINRKGWYFSFDSEPIFVTTFAPLYDKHSSRYMYLDKRKKLTAIKFAQSPDKVCRQSDDEYDSCFVLLQPEYSFLQHDLDDDTPLTNWEDPKTIRDRIRCAFKKVGQLYEIPSSVSYPSASHIVKPLNWKSDPAVTWWKDSMTKNLHEHEKKSTTATEAIIEPSS
jgi:hypothetical protein